MESNSLNGKEVHVSHNQAYTSVVDRSRESTARIPSGVNGSAAEDYPGRAFTKTADAGWTASPRFDDLSSDHPHFVRHGRRRFDPHAPLSYTVCPLSGSAPPGTAERCPSWLKERDWKSRGRGYLPRGFESLPLRHFPPPEGAADSAAPSRALDEPRGEVAERLNAAVSKTVSPANRARGFESPPLRHPARRRCRSCPRPANRDAPPAVSRVRASRRRGIR